MAEDDVLLQSRALKARFGGVSDMWIHRRLRDGSGFPQPLYIGQNRYWRLSEIIAWEQSLPRKHPAQARQSA
jgi:predicted DNA-binding transcriptional regulator AlpA